MELIGEIITPTSNAYVLNLPDKMIGKQVEVIAFELESKLINDKEDKMKRLDESLLDLKVDLSNFKFDRDEANNYDE